MNKEKTNKADKHRVFKNMDVTVTEEIGPVIINHYALHPSNKKEAN